MQTLVSMQVPTYRKLQSSLILQHPLEGKSNPMISFICSYEKGAPTPSMNVATLSSLWTTFENVPG